MNILHIVVEYGPGGYGSARYVSELGHRLRGLGHGVHVLVTNADHESAVDDAGFVHRLERKYPFFAYSACLETVLASIPSWERVVSLWESEGPFDAVVGHGWQSSQVATMVQRVYGCPLIATFHSITAGAGGPTRNAEETYVAEMERWFAGRADRIAVLSDYARRELIRHYGIPVEKIDVIPGGAGTESFSTQVDREDFRSMFAERAERIVLFAGRLTPEKGPEVLLGSMEVLARHNPVRAVFAGDGPLRESLVAEAERRGLADRVRFTGHVGPSVLGALYQVSDVFVAPSRYECFGWGAMEAVLHGLPVVASSVGALSDLARILPSGTMNPVAPGDHQGLAVVISQVLKSNGLKKRNPDPVQGRLPESMGWEPLANRALDQIQSLIGLVRE